MMFRTALMTASVLLLPGCVASAVTKPVKMAAKAADWATTSGDERDRALGRELRKKCKRDPDPKWCTDVD